MTYLSANYSSENIDDYEDLFGHSLLIEYPHSNFVSGVGLRDNSARTKVAVNFVASANQNLSAVDLYLKLTGAPIGNIYVEIYSNSGGAPNTLLGTSDTVDVSDISSSEYDRIRFEFSSPVALSASQTYFVVVAGTFAISAGNYVNISRDTSPDLSYRAQTYNGSAWAAQTYILIFAVYIQAQGRIAQEFRASGDQRVDHVVLYLKKSGTLTGNLFVEIVESDAGSPSDVGPDGNLSDGVAATVLTTSEAAIEFTFDETPQLEDGNKYYIILSCTGTLSAANNVHIGVDISTPTYTGNDFFRSNNDGTWYEFTDIDAAFQVYAVEEAVPSTLATELASLGDPPSDCYALGSYIKALVATLSTFYPSVLPALYGGTGLGQYQKGDILYATDPIHLEALPIGPPGTIMTSTLDETPAWVAGSNGVILMTNQSGFQLNPYDTVVLHRTQPSSIRIDNSGFDGNPFLMGIVQDIIPDGDTGPIMINGLTKARVNSTVLNGDTLIIDQGTRRLKAASPAFYPAAVMALEDGVSGGLVDVYINAMQVYPPAAQYLRITDDVTFPGSPSTWDNRPATTRIDARIYSGSVLVGFQGVVQNTSATPGIAQVGLYVDDAHYLGIGLARTLSLANNQAAKLDFQIPVVDLEPGAHTFDLGVMQTAGSFIVMAGFGVADSRAIPRSAIWIKE